MSNSPTPPEASRDASPQRDLDQSLLRGIAWTGLAKWGGQLLTWASTLFVARLLNPEDYGIVGMAAIYIGLVSLLNEFGIGSAIVTLRDLDSRRIAQLNTVAVGLGLLSFSLSFAFAPLLAQFFTTPELAPVVVAMSGAFIIASFRTVPYALMRKELRFPRLAVIEGAQSVIAALTMVGLAFAGFGYWTLVIGNIVGAVVWAAFTLMARRHAFAWPRLDALRSALQFSWQVLVGTLGWYVYANADFAVAGRVLGKSALGNYSFAWTLAGLPVDKITSLVGSVTPAYFAAVQTDPSALRRYLLRITEGLALITFPLTIGLALVADVLVPLVLGEQWLGVVAPLQILAAYASFRSTSPLLNQVLIAIRGTRFSMWNSVAAAILLPVGFTIAARWGTVGLALAWVVLHPCVTLTIYWRVFTRIDLRVAEYMRALWPALSSAALMTLAVLLCKWLEPQDWPLLGRLFAEAAVGAVVYLLCVEFLHRRGVDAVRELVALARQD